MEILISQARLADLAGASKLQLYVSPAKVLGQLDLPTAILLAEAKVGPGGSLSLVFYIPAALNNTIWSFKAVAFYGQGGYATSGVLTAIVNSAFFAPPPADSRDPDEGAEKETHSEEAVEEKR